MTLSRINHLGAATPTTITASITGTSTSLTLASGTGYPTSNFVVKLDAGTSSEEKILVGSRSGTTCSSLTRGYDGTTATSHSSGAPVEHDLAAVVIDDANAHIYDTTRDDHTEYVRTDGTRAITGTQTFDGGLTVVTGGLVVEAGGATITGNSTVTGTLTVTSLTQTADDSAWTNATLLNSWVSVGAPHFSPAYRKVNGRIYLRGAVGSGTFQAAALVLPVGYRPSATLEFSTYGSGGVFASVSINSSGNVTPTSGPAAGVWLDGILFDTL